MITLCVCVHSLVYKSYSVKQTPTELFIRSLATGKTLALTIISYECCLATPVHSLYEPTYVYFCAFLSILLHFNHEVLCWFAKFFASLPLVYIFLTNTYKNIFIIFCLFICICLHPHTLMFYMRVFVLDIYLAHTRERIHALSTIAICQLY